MKRKNLPRAVCVILIAVCAMTFMSSCAGYSDIESNLLVSGIAVDYADNMSFGRKEYLVTVEIIPMKSTAQGENSYSYLISQQADTFVEALRLISAEASKPLFYGHCKLLVIGHEVAEDGFMHILELVFRDSKLRLPMDITVTRNTTAKQILNTRSTMKSTNAYELIQMIENTKKNVGIAPQTKLLPLMEELSGAAHCSTMPYLGTAEDVAGEKISIVAGAAIIKDYRLVGFLNRENSLFWSIASDNYSKGIINCYIPSEERIIPLKILDNKTKISVNTENGELTVTFSADTTVSMIELPIDEVKTFRSEQEIFFREAAHFISQNMFNVVKDTIDRYDADIFGINEAVRSQYPRFWKDHQEDWDEVLSRAKIITEASVGLKSSDLSGKSITKGE